MQGQSNQPPLQSARLMSLSAMVVEYERFIYLCMHLALPVLCCRHHISRSMRGALLSAALSAVVDQVCVHDMGQVPDGEHATFRLGVSRSAMLHGDNCGKEKRKKQSFLT